MLFESFIFNLVFPRRLFRFIKFLFYVWFFFSCSSYVCIQYEEEENKENEENVENEENEAKDEKMKK